MSDTSAARPAKWVEKHPGMMGHGAEKQNLNQTGNPSARITEDEVNEAFGKTKVVKT